MDYHILFEMWRPDFLCVVNILMIFCYTVCCIPFTRYSRLSIRLSNRLYNRFDNRFDNRLYRVNGALGLRLGLGLGLVLVLALGLVLGLCDKTPV